MEFTSPIFRTAAGFNPAFIFSQIVCKGFVEVFVDRQSSGNQYADWIGAGTQLLAKHKILDSFTGPTLCLPALHERSLFAVELLGSPLPCNFELIDFQERRDE